MSFKIAILEDNADRRTAMQALLADQFPAYESIFFDDVAPMLAWLDTNWQEVALASLDHDLDLIPEASGKLRDPGDGRMVSAYLARRRATFPVILHSTNTIAVASMTEELTAAGVVLSVVTPYEDTTWIAEAWQPAVREMLSGRRNNS